jgi:hypothetical protein
LRFALRPVSTLLEAARHRAVELMVGYEQLGIRLPGPAARSLDEFMMSVALDLHPHNYTEAARARCSTRRARGRTPDAIVRP